MKDEDDRTRWGLRRRLEFIDFRLFWHRRVNRSDLSDTFGMSTAQASADIARYEALAPANMTYDRTAKCYVRAPGFELALLDGAIEAQLSQLIAVEDGTLDLRDTWFGAAPGVEVVTLRKPRLDPKALVEVLDALRGRREVAVRCASSPGLPEETRRIAPHGIFFAAGRWRVRAWAGGDDAFGDFDLHGMGAWREGGPPPVDASLDFEWSHVIDLTIVPNPALPTDRRRAVAARHAMVQGRLVRPCRVSASPYLMAEHDLDVAPGLLDPERQPIVLENREEVIGAQAATRAMARQALARSLGDGSRRGGGGRPVR